MSQRKQCFQIIVFSLLFVAGLTWFGSAAPNDPNKKKKPEGDKNAAAVEKAVEELSKEFREAGKEWGKARTKCSYFTETPSPDATPEAILDALEKPLKGNDVEEVYIRWQLLSGLPVTLDKKIQERLLKVYDKAPKLVTRPGVGEDRKQLDRMIMGAGQNDQYTLRQKYNEMVLESVAKNRPSISFRDELFHRMNRDSGLLQAGFKDAYERMQVGIDVTDHVKTVAEGTKAWANSSDTKPPQIQAMAQLISKLLQEKGTEYYDQPTFDINKKLMAWDKKTITLEQGKTLADLVEFLQDKAKNPGGLIK